MYYYIFESGNSSKDVERLAQVKETLANLGIAGEMAIYSHSKPVADLVNAAIQKRYSTIVAVGGINMINAIAKETEPHDVVLGIIPLVEHPDIEKLIGTTNWKTAAESLKRRRWQHVNLGLINDQYCFLTPATINLNHNNPFIFKSASFELTGTGGSITIIPTTRNTDETIEGITIEIDQDKSSKKGFFGQLFSKNDPRINKTILNINEFELSTTETVNLQVAGENICPTPIICSAQSKMLKLIVAKGVAKAA